MRRYAIRAGCTSWILLTSIAYAQPVASPAPSGPKPKFDVASIKPGDPSVRWRFQYRPEAGRFTATSATLTQFIAFAYDVRAYQLVGGPKGREAAAFTIDAQAEKPTPPDPKARPIFQLMLQDLLAERFHLIAHRETRDDRIYEFVIHKSGSKLVENTTTRDGSIRMAAGQLRGTAVPLFLLVNQLSQVLGRKVVDKTGLPSKYDFAAEWQPDSPRFGPDTPANSDAPTSLFTARREGLGLQLRPVAGPVDYIVIEELEKPDDN